MLKGIVVQARNSSTRFPEKMMHRLLGKPVIQWVLERCSRANVDIRVLATSTDPSDNALAGVAEAMGWKVIRGGLKNVLGRYVKAVEEFSIDAVVRTTGDCPLIDPALIEVALTHFLKEGVDYLDLTGIIDGFDVEVISGKVIIEAGRKARLPSEIEHVTPYIKENKKFKKVYFLYGDEDLSDIHLSLDYPEDAPVLEGILNELDSDEFRYEDVVSLIKKNPRLIEGNKHVIVNYGYEISKNEDKEFIKKMKAEPINSSESLKHLARTLKVVPGASQTFSKSHTQFSKGSSPLFVRKAQGCILEDIDGNSFIDYTMGLGACILGYSFGPVNEAMRKQLEDGTIYTLPHPLECELAELLRGIIPSAEMVRLGKNGSDVTSAAVRVARAYTGRDMIACSSYHGWQDWYIATTTRDRGVPEEVGRLTKTFQYNDVESLETLFDEYHGKIAAVIMEPVGVEEPRDDFLRKVKETTRKNGAILIFDEVLTGFRFSMGGAQEYFGVVPDLSCFGKSMGNGMPISAIVGKREIMELFDEVFFSFTFGGETLSIAAAISTIQYMIKNNVLDHIHLHGTELIRGVEGLIQNKEMEELMSIEGYPPRSVFAFKDDEGLRMGTLFQQEAVKRGLLFTNTHNVSLPHDEDVLGKTLSVYSEVMDILKYSMQCGIIDDMIEGELLVPVFRKA
jgi:glutamate-1-semialdehyde 2,1-aminomutase/spore coat polysaccharide biosynthesis protein SpsF